MKQVAAKYPTIETKLDKPLGPILDLDEQDPAKLPSTFEELKSFIKDDPNARFYDPYPIHQKQIKHPKLEPLVFQAEPPKQLTDYDPAKFHEKVPEYKHTYDERQKLEGGKVPQVPSEKPGPTSEEL